MPENSFLLVNLSDEKSKKLGELIGNKTARKILELLGKKEYTATDLAKELSLPLSTIHYNLTNLEQNNLIKADEYHYSAKGKEVKHYALANKLVIIAQEQPTESLVQKLKKILPVSILVGVMATVYQYYTATAPGMQGVVEESTVALKATAEQAVDSVAYESTSVVQDTLAETTTTVATEQNLMWLFLVVVMASIIAYVAVDFIIAKCKKK
ncbi:MAG: winged helix-turn-helix domain-containing protein [Nanoarchaeota archaeon]